VEVFCNGFPKSGNHALVKAVELLGLPARVNHVPFIGMQTAPINQPHVFIVRDPRNVIVSWLRFNRKSVTPGTFLAAFRKFQDRPLVEEMADYAPWLEIGHVVSYEALIAGPLSMRKMASYLGVPYLEGAWQELPGLTVTWNAVKSDYRSVWTPAVIKAWYGEGGGELLTRWGY